MVYGSLFSVSLFVCLFVFLYCVFSRIELLSKTTKKAHLTNGKLKVLPDFRFMAVRLSALPPLTHPLPPDDVICLKLVDLLSYIVWYTCTHVINVKRYCIVSKCFANTLAER